MILSALVSVVITFFIIKILILIDPFVIEKIWMLENLSGIIIWGIPLEEYAFAASLGFGASFFYEILTGKIPKV